MNEREMLLLMLRLQRLEMFGPSSKCGAASEHDGHQCDDHQGRRQAPGSLAHGDLDAADGARSEKKDTRRECGNRVKRSERLTRVE
jgi:hypothetical protein